MDYDNPLTDKITTWYKAVTSFAQGTFARMAVHALSVIVAGISLSNEVVYQGQVVLGGKFSFFFSYLGLVCLVPRGIGLNYAWLIPASAGLVHAASLLAFGLPWEITFFWAGLQTWILRFCNSKGKMGWEWAALPWLLIGVLQFLNAGAPLPRFTPLFLLIPVTMLGLTAMHVYKKFFLAPLNKRKMAQHSQTLKNLLSSNRVPKMLEAPLWQVVQQGFMLQAQSILCTKDAELVQDMQNISSALAKSTQNSYNNLNIESLSIKIEELNGKMQQRLQTNQEANAIFDPNNFPDNASPLEKTSWFRNSCLELLRKNKTMPRHLQNYLLHITASTEKILDVAASDPYKFKASCHFLGKYLPAIHKIIDDYLGLAGEGKKSNDVQEVLTKSEDLLARLAAAFENEHRQILQDNTINMKAELNVLDALLKIQGN